MSQQNILWTMPYLPWPITSGGKARQYHLLRCMAARGHRITLLVQSKTPLDDEARAALVPFVQELIVLPRRALKHPRTLWHAATSRLPLLTAINGFAPELSAQFEALLARQSWDVIQIEHSYGLQPFWGALHASGQPFLLVEHNVESELGSATYGQWPLWARPLVWYDQWRARRWERQALARADVVVAVTEDDAAKLKAIGHRPTCVVHNGVDTRGFAQVQPDPAGMRVLFVGNYEYAPNIDAVQWALDEVWPLIWQAQPQARFIVCGHAMPGAWAQRWADPRIEWRGYVSSLTEVQAQSAVFMAPLRSGGGSKLKVLEALAAGLPVVSTREGLSGLSVRDGVQARVADSAQAMAQAVVDLLSQPDQAHALGQSARQHVTQFFDWGAAASQLEQAHARLRAQTPVCGLRTKAA
ncbi:MAG: glycosyltransferase [Burkholderiaceae bacterium]|nr:MAG: glycosyltransferase [Burkholderiaceae bacterium]